MSISASAMAYIWSVRAVLASDVLYEAQTCLRSVSYPPFFLNFRRRASIANLCSFTRGSSAILNRGRRENGAAGSMAGVSAITMSAIMDRWSVYRHKFLSSHSKCESRT